MNKRIAFLAAAIGMAGLAGTHAAASAKTLNTVHEQRATGAKHTERKSRQGNYTEPFDPDFVSLSRAYESLNMTPMQYGMRYGNGASRKGKSNRLRYGHNAKVGRRG